MRLPQDSIEFVESFLAREVRFLIVGGHAVAAHGHVRSTGDIDLWIDRAPQNAARVVAAVTDFGLGSFGLTAADFAKPDQIIQFGRVPNRIDILTDVAGVQFEVCYPNRTTSLFNGVALPVIGLACLIANKVAVARDQDKADVSALRRKHGLG